MKYYQQGDVLMKPVDHVPQDAEKRSEPILAEGEATGHYHKATGEGVTVFRYKSELYMSAPAGAKIVHPEHKPVRIAPGDYQIEQVREYDHFGDLAETRQMRGRTLTDAVVRSSRPTVGLSRSAHIRRVVD